MYTRPFFNFGFVLEIIELNVSFDLLTHYIKRLHVLLSYYKYLSILAVLVRLFSCFQRLKLFSNFSATSWRETKPKLKKGRVYMFQVACKLLFFYYLLLIKKYTLFLPSHYGLRRVLTQDILHSLLSVNCVHILIWGEMHDFLLIVWKLYYHKERNSENQADAREVWNYSYWCI
jgi:hypothetical protein